jgi:hypothetical protein
MAYASSGGTGTKVVTSGTVGGDGAVTTGITAIKAGSNVTFTSAGTVVTVASSGGGSGSGNTLDAAYDQGGAGAGRTIAVDGGAVTLAGGAGEGEILRIETHDANGDGTYPFRVIQDTQYKFAIDNQTNGNMVHLKGPPQSTFASDQGTKTIDPTAVDLQFSIEDPSDATEIGYSAKSIGSGLFAGRKNTIGDRTSQTESLAHSDSERSSFSTIIGGGRE